MDFLDLSFTQFQQNLTVEETVLSKVDSDESSGLLRVWESASVCAVVGRGQTIENEVYTDKCLAESIGIYKRCSGGGTVLQGPGCLNYAFILPFSRHVAFSTISTTTSTIMKCVALGLQGVAPGLLVEGVSDLTHKGYKVSGNAQKRLRKAFLFHGTVLIDFDLSLVDRFLKHPSSEPDYRKGKAHSDFIRNLSITRNEFKESMQHLALNFDNYLEKALLDSH